MVIETTENENHQTKFLVLNSCKLKLAFVIIYLMLDFSKDKYSVLGLESKFYMHIMTPSKNSCYHYLCMGSVCLLDGSCSIPASSHTHYCPQNTHTVLPSNATAPYWPGGQSTTNLWSGR